MLLFRVNEIFNSIQGESSYSGYPTIFIRFTGCKLRCSYCDTSYAFYEGKTMNIEEILRKVESYNSNYVCLTGGEPLEQKNIDILIDELLERKKKISIETNGNIVVKDINKKVKIVMDVKTPSSKMSKMNKLENLNYLKKDDDVKFVCGSKEDFDYSLDIIKNYNLESRVNIIFSNVFDKLSSKKLCELLLGSSLKEARLQLQIHKYIWDKDTRAV